MERQYKNLGYVLIILIALVAAGFYKPYFALIPNFDPSITPLVQVHAIVLMGFVALLVAQPLLIRYKHRDLHQSLGKLTYFLMPLLIASCVGVILKEYGESLTRTASVGLALRSIFSDAAQLVLLALFYLLAILNRRNVPAHMRYMIAVALIIAPAGIARVLGYWFEVSRYASGLASNALVDAILIGLILYDRRNHLNYRPYVLALPLFLFAHVAFALLAKPRHPSVVESLPADRREGSRRMFVSRQCRLSGGAQFHPAIGQRHSQRRDFHSGNALTAADANFPRSRRRQIDYPAVHVGAAILDGDERAFARLEIGHFSRGAQRQCPARRIVVLRIHLFTVGHFSAGKHVGVEGRLTDAFFARPIYRAFYFGRNSLR